MFSISVRVSNELGRGSAKAASFSIWNTATTSFVIGFILFLFFLLLRGRLAYLFTDSQDVAKEVEQMSPLLAFSILMNSVQPVLSGEYISLIQMLILGKTLSRIMRKLQDFIDAGVAVGAGWQSIVAYVNIGCYYLVGIPVGVVLGYVFKLQVKVSSSISFSSVKSSVAHTRQKCCCTCVISLTCALLNIFEEFKQHNSFSNFKMSL